MIPYVYDKPRVLNLLGIDGKESTITVNKETEVKGEKTIIDLKTGKHDTVIKSGPGYATQRMESLDLLTKVAQYSPGTAPLLADIIVSLMDIPQSEKAVKRLETMLPPQVQAMEKGEGSLNPQQVMAMIQKAVEEYKNSLEGEQERLKTQQQRLKVEQERLQTEQERMKLGQEADKVKEIVAQMVAEGKL